MSDVRRPSSLSLRSSYPSSLLVGGASPTKRPHGAKATVLQEIPPAEAGWVTDQNVGRLSTTPPCSSWAL